VAPDSLAVSIDRDRARPLWKEYQRLMVEEAPVTVVYYPRGTAAVSERLQGVEIDGRGLLNTAPRWWIVPGKR
jgi:ABC-type transport system substrate-binding protein